MVSLLTSCTDPEISKLKRSAKQGDQKAAYRLGMEYLQGGKVKKNTIKAYDYFEASQTPEALYEASMLIYKDIVRFEDPGYGEPLAHQQMTKAAEKGLPAAQYQLGEYYEKGYGYGKELSMAYEWYFIAYLNGYEIAKDKAIEVGSKLPYYTKQQAQYNISRNFNNYSASK
jgi:hypothetical protein